MVTKTFTELVEAIEALESKHAQKIVAIDGGGGGSSGFFGQDPALTYSFSQGVNGYGQSWNQVFPNNPINLR